ncbi:MAG: hypothetical protein PHY48_03625 [Candidatus Cloacimonetes bacterium]|nr:hypothetical protein [Candidatus Cloacimonadota bacterium]
MTIALSLLALPYHCTLIALFVGIRWAMSGQCYHRSYRRPDYTGVTGILPVVPTKRDTRHTCTPNLGETPKAPGVTGILPVVHATLELEMNMYLFQVTSTPDFIITDLGETPKAPGNQQRIMYK